MSTPARTPAAGLPRTTPWPVRPAAPRTDAVERPAERPARPPVPASPVEEALDPRTIARASLAAGRNRSLWWTLGGVAACVAVSFATSFVVGCYALALLVLVFAVVRAVGPADGPAAVSVRSKPLDVVVLTVCGVVLAVLASVLPSV